MSQNNKIGHRQRLRERFLRGNESSRSEIALLELLLTYSIPQKDVEPLAQRLHAEFGSLSAVLESPFDTLCKIDGIKENSAVIIKLVDWIRQHYGVDQTSKDMVKPVIQTSLFDTIPIDNNEQEFNLKRISSRKKLVPRRGTDLFGKAVLKEAIQILPNIPQTESINEIRLFLRENLHFNAEQTRQRFSNYIIRHTFPEGYVDKPILMIAKAFPDTQDFRDVCFYRFLKAEPLEVEVIKDLIIPNLGSGSLSRERIRKFLSEKYPSAKSIVDYGKAIVDALTAAKIAKADRTKITFSYRDIHVLAFAFVLHSEFPEPGMYDILKLEENRFIQSMLWKPDQLLQSLYELRNKGLISKVSEIDNMRQFTTKYSLDEVVERLTSGRDKE